MTHDSLCFIDVETTGLNPSYNKVIEIGLIKVVNGKVKKKYKTLLNPQTFLDPFIENMTGINAAELEKAPLFEDIKDEFLDLLSDSIFIAHNARFDYSFIKHEFKRVGINFKAKNLCTVKLARALYPSLPRYNLDAIIENFNIPCKSRHRAFDDAKVIWDFYQISEKTTDPDIFQNAIEMVLRKPSLPIGISEDVIDSLPDSPGVYIFYGKENDILYIGKSINIQERVMSHFSNEYSIKDRKINSQITSIEVRETAGELGALLLESMLIKEHKPIYNRMLRESRKMPVLFKSSDKNGYYTIDIRTLGSLDPLEYNNILGVFRNQKLAKDYLYQIAKEFKLCPKILGIEKGRGYCFYYHLDLCNGACMRKEKKISYNLRFDEGFFKKKIQPWRFNGPIIIRETGNKEELHLVDKWCYLGSIKNEGENIEELFGEYMFDYDAYKILNRFIMNPKNERKIKVLSADFKNNLIK